MALNNEPQFLIAYDAGVPPSEAGYTHIVIRQFGPQIKEDMKLKMDIFIKRIIKPMLMQLFAQFPEDRGKPPR